MRLLLDTHVVLWALADPERLRPSARAAIIDPANDVLASAATAWEIAIKTALGKLTAPTDLLRALDDSGIETLPITAVHALAAGALPPLHSDPFDRMLVAQAQAEGLALVTRDPKIAAYEVSVLDG